MVELNRSNTGTPALTGRWWGVVLCSIAVAVVFLGQVLLLQVCGGFTSLLSGDVSTSTQPRPSGRVPSVSFASLGNTSLLNGRNPTTTVALLVTARAGLENSVSQVPFLQECLPSLLKTIKPDGKFAYSIYFGFDIDDPIYDNVTNLDYLRDRVIEQGRGYPLSLKFFRYNGTRGKPVWAWNRLARAAYKDEADYLYQVNDDVKFVTTDWTAKFVQALKANRAFPGLGVTGPCDVGNPSKLLLTQSFVSRVHLDIFKHFYPPLFRNWFSDDWITQVYHPEHLFKFPRIFVNNTLVQSTRYEIDYHADKVLKTLVSDGKASIEDFLQSNAARWNELEGKSQERTSLVGKEKRRWR